MSVVVVVVVVEVAVVVVAYAQFLRAHKQAISHLFFVASMLVSILSRLDNVAACLGVGRVHNSITSKRTATTTTTTKTTAELTLRSKRELNDFSILINGALAATKSYKKRNKMKAKSRAKARRNNIATSCRHCRSGTLNTFERSAAAQQRDRQTGRPTDRHTKRQAAERYICSRATFVSICLPYL